ncbi:hypothetical protein [Trujillonella endophytica]|uniref:Uncharacterized protein n=1 Tax=Trujillonella endophytica TaxID=673521 RepID=A0A1H8PE89_9ACTN|nr:hypothetical protein [Trujillella endophytica]SEO40245.1 hypothetical protein SAMN05660991_00131 [Trujillella endophytica]
MTSATATAPLALVDVEDLEDGDLAARIAELGMPGGAAPRAVLVSAADRQAEIDAVVAAWTVVSDGHAALAAHTFGARAAALVV